MEKSDFPFPGALSFYLLTCSMQGVIPDKTALYGEIQRVAWHCYVELVSWLHAREYALSALSLGRRQVGQEKASKSRGLQQSLQVAPHLQVQGEKSWVFETVFKLLTCRRGHLIAFLNCSLLFLAVLPTFVECRRWDGLVIYDPPTPTQFALWNKHNKQMLFRALHFSSLHLLLLLLPASWIEKGIY